MEILCKIKFPLHRFCLKAYCDGWVRYLPNWGRILGKTDDHWTLVPLYPYFSDQSSTEDHTACKHKQPEDPEKPY